MPHKLREGISNYVYCIWRWGGGQLKFSRQDIFRNSLKEFNDRKRKKERVDLAKTGKYSK